MSTRSFMPDASSLTPARREPTTSLHAFSDFPRSDPTVRRRIGWRSADAMPSVALVCGVAVLVTTVIIGSVGALAMQGASQPVVVGVFLLVAAVAGAASVAATRVVVSHARTGSGGRLRAVVGASIAIASVVLLQGSLFSPPPAQRAPGNGPITAAGPMLISDLLRGDCLAEPPTSRYDDPTGMATVVPCAQPHAAQVIAVLSFPTDDAQMMTMCAATARELGQTDDLGILAPTQEFRANYQMGQLLCLAS